MEASDRSELDRLSVRDGPSRHDDAQPDTARLRKIWRFGKFQLARGSINHCVAGLRDIVGDASDHWCLTVSPCPGRGPSVPIAGRPAGPRDLRFEPLRSRGETVQRAAPVLVLLIPADLFGARLDILARAPFAIPDAGLGAILVDYILALEQRLPGLRESELSRLAGATRLLVAACLSNEPRNRDADGERLISARMQRVHYLIGENLRSPTFGEADIRQALGISRSSLYRLFNGVGGVKRYIQRERLMQARALLADPRNGKPIFKIAEEMCFCDASSFSRAFKCEFGVSPRAVRANAAADASRQVKTIHDRRSS